MPKVVRDDELLDEVARVAWSRGYSVAGVIEQFALVCEHYSNHDDDDVDTWCEAQDKLEQVVEILEDVMPTRCQPKVYDDKEGAVDVV